MIRQQISFQPSPAHAPSFSSLEVLQRIAESQQRVAAARQCPLDQPKRRTDHSGCMAAPDNLKFELTTIQLSAFLSCWVSGWSGGSWTSSSMTTMCSSPKRTRSHSKITTHYPAEDPKQAALPLQRIHTSRRNDACRHAAPASEYS